MLKDLVNLANSLDNKGLLKEADLVDRIIKEAEVSAPLRLMADRAAAKWSADDIADIAEKLPAQKLVDIATKMDSDKKREVIMLMLTSGALLAEAEMIMPGIGELLPGSEGSALGEAVGVTDVSGASEAAGELLGQLGGTTDLLSSVTGIFSN